MSRKYNTGLGVSESVGSIVRDSTHSTLRLYRVYKLTHASCFLFIIKMPATDAAVADSRSGLWFNGLNINRLSESQPALLQINSRRTTEAHVQNNFLFLIFKAFCGGSCDKSENPTNCV